MERLLDAAETLLERETFESLRVQDVVRQAGVTTGALYSRFGSKDGLLRALEARLHQSFGQGLEEVLDPSAWATEPLRPLLEALLTRMLRGYRTRRGLVRAVALASRRNPEPRARVERFNEDAFIRPLTAALLERSDIDHADRDGAVQFALFMLAGALSAFAVFPETDPLGLDLPDDVFVRRLALMVDGYLRPEG